MGYRSGQMMRGALLCGVLTGALAWNPASARAQATDPQVIAPIQTFMDAFNKGDIAGAAATHAADVVILDEPPPFLWSGPKAFDKWVADLTADAKQRGITDQAVKIGAPTRVEVQGVGAYVIAPAVYTFKEKGVAMRATSQMTFALKKGASGWLIHAWTWTGPRAQKAAGK